MSDARAAANALFKSGDIAGAVAAYEGALLESQLDANRLTILSNLGLCHMKLAAPRQAAERLKEGLRLHVVCYANPSLAAKVAGRLIQASEALGDAAGRRAAVAECRFYLSVPGASAPGGLSLAPPPEPSEVIALLSAIGSASGDEGLSAVRAELGRVPGESLDENGIHALILCIHVASMREPVEWGLSLVSSCLESGVPVDARSENGRTALMIASNSARHDIVELLLSGGADASATDGDGFSPLHTALADLSDHELSSLLQIVRALVARGAPVDAMNAKGMAPLMYCAQEGGENGLALCDALLKAGASTRVRSAVHLGFSAYDFALKHHGRDSKIATLLRTHAEGYSREARLSCRQSDLTFAYRMFVEEKLRLPREPSRGAGSEEDSRVRLLAEAAGLTSDDDLRVTVASDGVVSNPLGHIWSGLGKSLPRALTAPRSSNTLHDDEEANELRLLIGNATAGAGGRVKIAPQPWMMLAKARAKGHALPPEPAALEQLLEARGCHGSSARFVPRGVYDEYAQMLQTPLQTVFSPAIPNDDALATLGLHAPLCELRARQGYWSALLRARGVECVCYDEPHARSASAKPYTEVEIGGVSMAAEHAQSHTLLLVCPDWSREGSERIQRGSEAPQDDSWDAAALRAYYDAGGRTVAHVGNLGDSGLATSSTAFIALLSGMYERHLNVRIPCWPGGHDELTIWARKEAVVDGSTSGVLQVRMELVDLEAPEWASADRKGGPMMPSTSAFGKEGDKVFQL